jgi:hypothetical protein
MWVPALHCGSVGFEPLLIECDNGAVPGKTLAAHRMTRGARDEGMSGNSRFGNAARTRSTAAFGELSRTVMCEATGVGDN